MERYIDTIIVTNDLQDYFDRIIRTESRQSRKYLIAAIKEDCLAIIRNTPTADERKKADAEQQKLDDEWKKIYGKIYGADMRGCE